jgi:hypothetical protein
MGLDFSQLKVGAGDTTLIDPGELFAALPGRASKYSYLRDVQAEVLNQWFARRDESDLVIKMNTGAGKTIVGLLALASSQNEQVGPVLYLTPDRYLADQVINEATSLGVTTVDDPRSPAYQSSRSICVTTVQKLFNGRTVFGLSQGERINIGTVLVDDAHACLRVVREQFSVVVPRASSTYDQLFELVRPALEQQSRARTEQLKDGDPTANMLVPPWAWATLMEEVIPLLTARRDDEWMKFSWPLVRDVVEHCRVAVTSKEILIAPPCLPVDAVPSFRLARRRLYLTATLADDSILITDLAASLRSIEQPISPSKASDLGDRMILSPLETYPKLLHEDLRQLMARLALERNVVVIVPSRVRAELWSDVTDKVHRADTLSAVVEDLRNGHVGLVVLVNKYDGIDLPDDACRILVIDGVPTATSPLERIDASYLDGTESLIHQQLQRVEQGMGRGIRSNEDYCVVILADARLAASVWSHGVHHFSAGTAAQLDLSRQVTAMLADSDVGTLEAVILQCLNRDPDWVRASRGVVATVKNPAVASISATARPERAAFDLAVLGRYQDAVAELQGPINSLDDPILRGWLKQQAAAYMSLYDRVRANDLQRSAQQENRVLLRPSDAAIATRTLRADRPQADAAAEFLSSTYSTPQELLLGVEALTAALQPNPEETEAFERAMVDLAHHLGFEADRPEQELGLGPDVLWALGGLRFLVIECKSGATAATISRRDLAQLGHSHDWFVGAYDSSCSATPMMIHPSSVCSADAVAAPTTRIMTFEKLASLRTAVSEWSVAVAATGGFETDEISRRLAEHQLHAGAFPDQWAIVPRRSR